MKEHKKVAFIITLVLLVIFIPFTILGYVYHKKYNAESNPNHEFYYMNKLWFYDESDNLLGTYDCNYSNCGYAMETILDNAYGINSPVVAGLEPKPFINNRYAIISDYSGAQTEVKLVDLVNKNEPTPFAGYKMYNMGLQGNLVIIKNNSEKYGVLDLSSDMQMVIKPTYDYIALQNERDDSNKKIRAEKFIVLDSGKWKLIDKNDNDLTVSFPNPIISYNNSMLVTKSKTTTNEEGYTSEEAIYNIYEYDGSSVLPGNYKYLRILGRYIEVLTDEGKYYIVYADTRTIATQSVYDVYDPVNIQTRMTETGIDVIIENELKENLAL